MNMVKAHFLQRLKEKNIQATPQRLAIFEKLVCRDDHPSAEMIFNQLKDEFPSLTLVTVYNTLQKLESSGLCCKINPLHNSARYDGNAAAHMHLICSGCGKVVDLRDVPFAVDLPQWVGEEFNVMSHNVSFFGLCRTCQSADTARSTG